MPKFRLTSIRYSEHPPHQKHTSINPAQDERMDMKIAKIAAIATIFAATSSQCIAGLYLWVSPAGEEFYSIGKNQREALNQISNSTLGGGADAKSWSLNDFRTKLECNSTGWYASLYINVSPKRISWVTCEAKTRKSAISQVVASCRADQRCGNALNNSSASFTINSGQDDGKWTSSTKGLYYTPLPGVNIKDAACEGERCVIGVNAEPRIDNVTREKILSGDF